MSEVSEMSHRPLRVLVHEVLSAGFALDGISPAEQAQLLGQGQAMRDAMAVDLLALRGIEVLAVESTACPAWPGCTPVRAAPNEAPDALLARLAPTVDAVWSVAPETCGLLLACAEAVIASPARWLGCSAPVIRSASSKQATRRALAAAGVAVPAEADQTDAPGPWVVKPDDGAGCTATHRWPDGAGAQADLAARQARGEAVTLERWVDGPARSLTLLCAAGRAELLAINHQQIGVDAHGDVHYLGVQNAVEPLTGARAASLAALGGQVAAALPGLWGVVGIDFVESPTGPVVIEVNPRLTSAYVGLSARLGRNLAQVMLAQAALLPQEA